MNYNTDEFFSLVKRKNVLGMVAYIMNQEEQLEAAKIATETTRLTVAAVDRIRGAIVEDNKVGALGLYDTDFGGTEDGKFEEPLPEFADAVVEQHDNEISNQFVEALTPSNDNKTDEIEKAVVNEISNQFKDLEKLIAKGKKKKAKKLYAAMEEGGLKGSEMKRLKNEIKGL